MRKKKESFFWSLNQTQTVKSSQIRMIISLTYNTYSKKIPVSQYNLKYFEPQMNVSKNSVFILNIFLCLLVILTMEIYFIIGINTSR